MYNRSFFLLIFLLLFLISKQSQTVQLSSYNCVIIYNKLNDSSLSLDHCESINNSSNTFWQQNWIECINLCCGLSSQTYPNFDLNSLSECEKNNQIASQANNIVQIVIITISTIVGVFILIVILKKIFKKLKKSQVQPMKLRGDLIKITTDIKKPIWLDCNLENSQITLSNFVNFQQNECPICLQDKINTVTVCKHSFHIKCLLDWFKKNRNCPLCKSTKIDSLKLYCKNCNNKYILLSANQTKKNNKWSDFVNICDSCCNASPKIRGRASTRDTSFGKLNISKEIDDIEVIYL